METKHVLTFNIKLNDDSDKQPVNLTVDTSGLTPEDVMAYALRSIKIDWSRQARYDFSSGGSKEKMGSEGFEGFVAKKNLTYTVPKPSTHAAVDVKAVTKSVAVSYVDKYPKITNDDLVAVIKDEMNEAELAAKYLVKPAEVKA